MASSPLTASEETRRQRSQSVALFVGVCLGMAVAFCLLGAPLLQSARPSLRLMSRINPNTASAASLIRLPGIGPARAAAIIAFRDRFAEEGGDEAAFRGPADLEQIRGIGPKTVESLAPWLRFEGYGDGAAAGGIDGGHRVMLESD